MAMEEYQNAVTSIQFHYVHIEVLANETIRMAKFKDLSSITLRHNQTLRLTSIFRPYLLRLSSSSLISQDVH